MVAPQRGPAGRLRDDAAAGAGAQRRDRLAQRRPRIAQRHPGLCGPRASLAERRRFLRHLRPWWDVHRHKIAPAIGAKIEAMQAEARLAVAAGKLVSAEAADGGAIVRFRARGQRRRSRRCGRRGSSTAPARRPTSPAPASRCSPPCSPTAGSGPTRSRIGIDVDPDCRAIGADGSAERDASRRSARSPAAPSGRASPCPTSGSRRSAWRRGWQPDRHCEARSDAAIQIALDCFAALAMTSAEGSPLRSRSGTGRRRPRGRRR